MIEPHALCHPDVPACLQLCSGRYQCTPLPLPVSFCVTCLWLQEQNKQQQWELLMQWLNSDFPTRNRQKESLIKVTSVTLRDRQLQREGEDTEVWRVCGISDRKSSASVLFLIKVIWSLCTCIYWLGALEGANLSDSTRRGQVAWRRIFPPMPSPFADLMLSLSRSNSSPGFLLCAQNECSNYTARPPKPFFIYNGKIKSR